jgi:hypothetical protein
MQQATKTCEIYLCDRFTKDQCFLLRNWRGVMHTHIITCLEGLLRHKYLLDSRVQVFTVSLLHIP